jgi:hypothetical protein
MIAVCCWERGSMAWGRLRPEKRSIRLPAATTAVTKSETTNPSTTPTDAWTTISVMTWLSVDGSASCCSVPAAKKATAPANADLEHHRDRLVGERRADHHPGHRRTKASTKATAKAADKWSVIPAPPAPWSGWSL